jgi:hypothetical protein
MGNATGSVKFLALDSGRTIVRDQFTILPVPDIVISHMNRLADQSRKGLLTPLDFAMGSPNQSVLDRPPEDFSYSPDNFVPIDGTRVVPADDHVVAPETIVIEHAADINPADVLLPVPAPATPPVDPPLADELYVFEPLPEPEDRAPDPEEPPPEPEDRAPDPEESPPEPEDPPSEPEEPPTTVPVDNASHPYSTRSRSRGAKSYWDRRTQTMVHHPTEQVLLARSVASRRSSGPAKFVFNISVKAAMAKMPRKALESMYKEITQMVDKRVFRGVAPSFKHKKKVIKSFLFLKEKHLSNGQFDKLKSRLVAGGHMQDKEAALFEDISSPTASLPFIFMVGCIAARDGRHVKTVDITGAYLNADISRHEILMELDATMAAILIQIDPSYEKFMRSNGTMVVQLEKALYGCIESAKLWYDLLAVTLESDGYIKNSIDGCVFNKTVDGVQCTVVVYVDDLFITCKDMSMIDSLEALLRDKFKEITVHDGPVHSYLGMTWDFFSASKEVKVTMEGYVDDLLKCANITGTAASPAAEHLFNIREAPALDDPRREEFHSLVAKILYLAKRTRPDVLLPIAFLTTRVQKPDEDDWLKLQRVLKYLNGSKGLGIILRPRDILSILAYIDASYGVHADGKSHSGMFISMGLGPTLVKSSKQRIVTKSSTEAELIALSDMCSLVIWSRDFLLAQGEDPPPATVYQDNQSTMAMIERGASTSERSRHVKIRYFWVKDKVDSGEIKIVYLPTEDMTADVLTKPMQGEKFLKFRSMILNWCF